MAVFDAKQRKVVVRVVYDGPGHAGKSTNVRQLEQLFTPARRTDVVTPEEVDGRTQYFDFVQIEGGLVLGHALRCQAVSVPGQPHLASRRAMLLDSADSVVFVCAATEEGLTEAAPMYRVLVERLAAFPERARPGLIVQLNKTDLALDDARSTATERLGVEGHVRIVLARADRGTGVRDTIALAMRAAAERAQAAILEHGPEAIAGSADDANTLLLSMQRASESPPTSGTFTGGARTARVSTPDDTADALPPVDTPPERLWPTDRGSEILRRFWAAGPPRRLTPTGLVGEAVVTYESGLWTCSHDARRTFPDVEAACAELRALGEQRASLGALLPRNTAMAVAEASRGGFAVHTIRPGYASIGQQLMHAAREGNARGVGESLLAYAAAVVEGIALAVERDVRIELGPDDFASVGPAIYYVGEPIARGGRHEELASAILDPVARVENFGAHAERYVVALEHALAARFSEAELSAVGLTESLRAYTPRSGFTMVARARLLHAAMGKPAASAAT